VATREEVLAMLTAQARDGRVASAIALARELREDGAPDPWQALGIERQQQ
jgi:hypothetical protein